MALTRDKYPINQDVIAKKIFRYCQANNLPYPFDERGICNGFTALWLYKSSKGQRTWFYELLGKISSTPDDKLGDIESDLKKLLKYLTRLQKPESLIPGVTQSINFSKVAKWDELYADIAMADESDLVTILNQLEPNEMLRLNFYSGLLGHSIGIIKDKDGYHLYDPNFKDGEMTCHNVKEVATEIFKLAQRFNIKDVMPIYYEVLLNNKKKQYTESHIDERKKQLSQTLSPVMKTGVKRKYNNHTILSVAFALMREDFADKAIQAGVKYANNSHQLVKQLTTLPEPFSDKMRKKYFPDSLDDTIEAVLTNNPMNTELTRQQLKKYLSEAEKEKSTLNNQDTIGLVFKFYLKLIKTLSTHEIKSLINEFEQFIRLTSHPKSAQPDSGTQKFGMFSPSPEISELNQFMMLFEKTGEVAPFIKILLDHGFDTSEVDNTESSALHLYLLMLADNTTNLPPSLLPFMLMNSNRVTPDEVTLIENLPHEIKKNIVKGFIEHVQQLQIEGKIEALDKIKKCINNPENGLHIFYQHDQTIKEYLGVGLNKLIPDFLSKGLKTKI